MCMLHMINTNNRQVVFIENLKSIFHKIKIYILVIIFTKELLYRFPQLLLGYFLIWIDFTPKKNPNLSSDIRKNMSVLTSPTKHML